MTDVFAARLRDLAEQDPAVAPLARLQAEALEAASDAGWRAAVPVLAAEPPYLHGTTIQLDPDVVNKLFARLGASVTAGPLALLEASLAQDAQRLLEAAQPNAAEVNTRLAPGPQRLLDAAQANAAEVESTLAPDALVVIAQVASLPLLLACGAEAASRLQGLVWEHGSCPVCAAWPTLLEVRGLERQRWLRCGRCGSGWQQLNALCAFCGSNEYRRQGYLAPEKERESRQALVCHACRGYLKAFTTLGPLAPGEVLLRDLLSLELDLAAMDQGFSRPAEPALKLDVRVEPLAASVSRR